MLPDPNRLASLISQETGLAFSGRASVGGVGERILTFQPTGHEERHTFAIHTKLKFRRLELEFQPGPYAGDLLEAMSRVDAGSQLLFATVMAYCEQGGATVVVRVDDIPTRADDAGIWNRRWRRFQVTLQRNNIAIGADDEGPDEEILRPWLLKFCAAITALLPLEPASSETANLEGLPEGALQKVQVNRYERDRRNRAAALALHGYACAACEMRFDDVYGDIGMGFIEVHHVTPVSQMGAGYIVNPRADLIPLCSNCHSMVHRQNPPLSLDELRMILQPKTPLSE